MHDLNLWSTNTKKVKVEVESQFVPSIVEGEVQRGRLPMRETVNVPGSMRDFCSPILREKSAKTSVAWEDQARIASTAC